MLDVYKSLLYIDMHVGVCAEDRSENVRVLGGLQILIRAGLRKRCHSDGACEMSCRDFKASEEI